jgi:hypothetical protein
LGPTRRFSRGWSEAEAIRLAKEFVAANGGEEWTCWGAKPDNLAPGYKRRKNVIKWSVLFDRAIDGATVDGPAIVLVDIEAGDAGFF